MAWIKITQLKLSLDNSNYQDLIAVCCKKLKVNIEWIEELKVIKKAIDARRKPQIYFVFTVEVKIDKKYIKQKVLRDDAVTLIEKSIPEKKWSRGNEEMKHPPVVIGTGPAGLFAALSLAQNGYRPLVFERGKDVISRARDVEVFWNSGELKVNSNVQFGEGGAGTFSDGKLTTRIKDHRLKLVLSELIKAGAPEEIDYEQKPHLGTDKLIWIVQNLRRRIIELGGQVFFNCQVTDFLIEQGKITGVEINSQWQINADKVVLAIGHSARDTFAKLVERDVAVEQKPFSMGVRIEHPQQLIDNAQYGDMAGHPQLGAADYQLVYKNPELEKTAYTFCMCPGGQVVAAASELNTVVTNGMSKYARDTGVANSGLVVSIGREDLADGDPLAGVKLQRSWEQNAYIAGGKNYCAPAQSVGDFLKDQTRGEISSPFEPTYKPGVTPYNLNELLPKWASQMIGEAIRQFDNKLIGFSLDNAVLTGVETRTSSPVRIKRGESLESVSVGGLYPTGEGAGYAGGIISAAVDGVRVAEAIVRNYNTLSEGVMRELPDGLLEAKWEEN